MQQALVADILRHLHPPPRTQTLFNGGMPMARKAIATAYREGMTHGVEVDIVNFYASIKPDRLAELLRPLPASAVEHVVWDVALRDGRGVVAAGDYTTVPTPSPLMGLSLGAVTSPIVGERVVARLLAAAQLPDTTTYADNLFVSGRSAAEVIARISKLREGVASADVGELGLRVGHHRDYDLSYPFVFLRQVVTGKRNNAGELKSEPCSFNWEPDDRKIAQYQLGAADRALTLEEIAAAERRIGQWRRSYPSWPAGDYFEAEYLGSLSARRYYLQPTPDNLSAAIRAIVVAHIASRGDRHPSEIIPTEGDRDGHCRDRLLREVTAWLERARPLASAS